MKISYQKTVFMKITLKKNLLIYHYDTNSIALTEVAEHCGTEVAFDYGYLLI